MTGPEFRVSSFCHLSGCVAVTRDGDDVHVRHSDRPDVQLRFSMREWEAFLLGVCAGEFDQLIHRGGPVTSEPAVPDPGSVTIPDWAVENLRARLVRCMDESLTDHQRHEERVMLVGALQYHLNGPLPERENPR